MKYHPAIEGYNDKYKKRVDLIINMALKGYFVNYLQKHYWWQFQKKIL